MKDTLFRIAIVIMLFTVTASCNNTGNQPSAGDTVNEAPLNTDTSLAGNNEQILADDSATIQTADGVTDEEANAKAKLKEDAQKLMQDQQK